MKANWNTIVLLLLLFIGSHALLSQIPSGGYVLHVNTQEVFLDVVVTDRQGNFVNGLKPTDFTVFEDKVKQRIAFFQPPSMHAMPADAPEVQSSADLGKIGDAPVTILVLDELNTKFEDMAFARGAMEKWLNRQPAKLTQPTVLLVASDEKFAALHDYTQDRGALLLALKHHFPSYPYRMSKGGSNGPDAGDRMALSLGTLLQIAQASSGTPGRKNVIWVGVGFPSLMLDDVAGTKEDEITNAVVHATETMLKARVTLNIIDPTAMATSSLDLNNPDNLSLDDLVSAEGPTSSTVSGILNFATFAPATGGSFAFGRNDVDRMIETAVNNGSNYYTLSYVPTGKDDDPAKFRDIQIVMRDPALTATTRTGYFPPAKTNPGQLPNPPATQQLAFDLTNAGLSSMIYNGLKVNAVRSSTGYLLHVHASELEPRLFSNGDRAAEVTVMQVCFGNKNKVLAHNAVELKAKMPEDLSSSSIDFAVPMQEIPRGTLRIRFVVRDALNGHIGTIDLAP